MYKSSLSQELIEFEETHPTSVISSNTTELFAISIYFRIFAKIFKAMTTLLAIFLTIYLTKKFMQLVEGKK